MAFTLTSPAFENGQPIPERHARRGANLSPFLLWEDPPPGTRSYVLVMEDADAPSQTFRHWAVYDIPGDRRQLAEGRSSKARTEDLPHGFNDFGNLHYDGPDPKPGDPPHTYRFRLAALGVDRLEISPEPDALDIWEAARDSMLAEAELTGTYG
ncbi:YbhB/YbcL family Raf kinase inhibitor-like protein [Phyllobacterium phragmitis]|uniref:YbhB/YbcL family Raf kinase inhibitor-like protein n=1 Tax=Phyllobacterium phragmitis TaxID=2670329 RepID=A0ABQ0H3P3_9HYPH